MTPETMHELVTDQGKQTAQLEHISETLSSIKTCLLGNGKEGLIVRTDRLEQKDKMRGKFFWALFGIVAALVIQSVAQSVI
jgi:hypothetical protein